MKIFVSNLAVSDVQYETSIQQQILGRLSLFNYLYLRSFDLRLIFSRPFLCSLHFLFCDLLSDAFSYFKRFMVKLRVLIFRKYLLVTKYLFLREFLATMCFLRKFCHSQHFCSFLKISEIFFVFMSIFFTNFCE
jgi:hypothetical protein